MKTDPFKWHIDVDHRATGISPAMANNLGGTAGPREICGLDVPLPDTFRLLDVDGNVLYEGRTNAGALSLKAGSGVSPLDPLTKFGAYRGATTIEYLHSGEWKPVRRKA